MRSSRNTCLLVESLEARETPATLYVSSTGTDTNPGTVTAPLQTLQAAANRVVAGDSVVVEAGTYRGFSSTKDGTAAARITFQADPTLAPGSVIINQPNGFTGRDGINLEGASYVTIQGFTITGQARAGIRSVTNEFVVIRDNVADNNGVWGIFTGFSSDVRIENNQASRSQQQHGIYVSNSADRPVVRGNTVFENHLSGIQLNADASVGGDGIITGAVIENNIIRSNGAGGGASINLDGVQNSDIRNNVIDNARASGIALFRIDGGGGSSNNRIVNNTIVVDNSLNTAAGRWAVTISGGSTGNVLKNNIIFSSHSFRGAISVTSDSRSGLVSDYNAVEDRFSIDGGGAATGLAGWQAATGQDLHSLRLIDFTALNVLFLNRLAGDYHLHALSPAVDRGTATGAPGTDFEGSARPSGLGFDIGADEFGLSNSSSASYVGTDTTTRGSWRGVYGTDGYSLAQGATSLPSYGTTAPRGHSNWTWSASTSDTRALQKPAPAADRLAAVWYGNTFTVDVSVGSTERRVSLYMTDWDNAGRSQRIEVLDAATGVVLDTRTVSGFGGGVWLSWDLVGAVQFRVTRLSGINAVINGIFLGSQPASSSASYVGTDTTTRGSWRGVYGTDGYSLAQGATSLPSYGTTAPRGHSNWTWSASTSDTRALQKPAPAADRLAAVWYGNTFTVDVSVGSTERRVSLYMTDWDNAGRSQRIEVLDAATGVVLDTRTVSGFGGGVWLSWDLVGAVQFRVTRLSGINAVINGIFLGSQPASSSASYVGTDTTTRGSWRGVYGTDGYSLAQGATSLPSYGTTAPRGHSNWTWSASTSDTRALQKPAPAADRLAAVWYGNTFTVDVSVGSTERRVSLYMTDWDNAGRSQRIEVLDAATGVVLDTRTVSGFGGGVWLSWDLVGAVQFRVTRLSGINAVINGIFLGNASASISTPSEFTVAVRSTGLTSSQQAIFQQAAQRWSEIIVGDLPNATYNGVAIDDILIDVALAPRDGQGGTLAFAGPDYYRMDTGLPYHGTITFDSADIGWLESSGNLFNTVVHEMGHVLGIGTLWAMKSLIIGSGTANPVFTGPRATAEYNRIFGASAVGVPVESSGGSGTAYAHWRESVFGNEVMTGWVDTGIKNPISRITVAALADQGYTVDMNAADNYPPPS